MARDSAVDQLRDSWDVLNCIWSPVKVKKLGYSEQNTQTQANDSLPFCEHFRASVAYQEES